MKQTSYINIGENGKGHLYIVRGVPGSGKSTYAKELKSWYEGVYHFEADMWFERSGEYKFDPTDLHRAHRWCLNTVQTTLNQGKKVVVANTFTTYKELKDYLKYAKANGHGVTLITMGKEYGSIHNVPEETMQRMRERFESHESIIEKFRNVDQSGTEAIR